MAKAGEIWRPHRLNYVSLMCSSGVHVVSAVMLVAGSSVPLCGRRIWHHAELRHKPDGHVLFYRHNMPHFDDVDKIVFSIAAEINFHCRKRGSQHKYVWWIDNGDPRIAGVPRLPIPHDATANPCCEIPLNFELYVVVTGTILFIHYRDFRFDLNDPSSISELKTAFNSLDTLANRIMSQSLLAPRRKAEIKLLPIS